MRPFRLRPGGRGVTVRGTHDPEAAVEKTAYAILLLLAVIWLAAMVVGMVAAFPFGVLGLLGLVAVGLLLIKVLRERLANADDDYYSKHVDQ